MKNKCNHVETMIRLHSMQKDLKKIIKDYSRGDVTVIKNVNGVDMTLRYGVLTLHALGHNLHDLSINLAKGIEGFWGDNYATKEQMTNATHLPGKDHTNLWNPDNYKEYDKEKKGE